jgi:hypothetical protein
MYSCATKEVEKVVANVIIMSVLPAACQFGGEGPYCIFFVKILNSIFLLKSVKTVF